MLNFSDCTILSVLLSVLLFVLFSLQFLTHFSPPSPVLSFKIRLETSCLVDLTSVRRELEMEHKLTLFKVVDD